MRNTINKRMLQPRHISSYTPELDRISSDLIRHIRRVRDERGAKSLAESLSNEMYKWSMECVGHIVFDTRMGCLQPQMPARVQEYINGIQSMMTSSIHLIVGEQFHYKVRSPIWWKHSKAWDKIFKIGESSQK